MAKRMLIDATHAEETRVAVVDGNRLVEFDYESKLRKQLKGSIFLAKVTRVEPSLQAAFVNFGGNRHGFLPFSEIHPDYFRIPVADREALMAAQQAELEAAIAAEEAAIAAEEAAYAAQQNQQNETVADAATDSQGADDVTTVGARSGGDEISAAATAPSDEEQGEVRDQSEEQGDDDESDSESDEADCNEEAGDESSAEDTEGENEGEAEGTQESAPKVHKFVYRAVSEINPETFEITTFTEHEATAYDQDVAYKVEELAKTREDVVRVRLHYRHSEDGVKKRSIWVAFHEDNQEIDHELALAAEQEERENRRNNRGRGRGRGRFQGGRGRGKGMGRGRHPMQNRQVEVLGGDGVDGDQPFRPSLHRNYKIQEVIKRGQIMLIQVQKEERGNKGAAVTSYLSLPGRYCVLMPNSPRGGGVSRKIASFAERKRMREILRELGTPDGMSVILRTAGVQRDQDEIKRDLDYLVRLWNNIRELTLKSSAPAMIYEESNLVKRAVRDIFASDIEEIQVSGERSFDQAREFMSLLMPSSVERVVHYQDDKYPLFHRYQVENQIAEMGEPVCNLRSGGYLVINPTEALVSIDVNSGRATKERHIEETALKTNLEAAEEVARQLRLRDLGGLVVIDFIDMEDHRNNAKVERRLREALSTDRARIQVGRISSFGLLELSRQRLNPSLTEAQFEKCPHCKGVGYIRTIDSAVILALRALEDEGIRNRSAQVVLTVPNEIALYILNQKRDMLADIERRYGFTVFIRVDEELAPTGFTVEGIKAPAVSDDDESDAIEMDEDAGGSETSRASSSSDEQEGGEQQAREGRQGRGQGRGRGRGRDRNREDTGDVAPQEQKNEPSEQSAGADGERSDGREGGRRRDGRSGNRESGGRERGGRGRGRDRNSSSNRQEPATEQGQVEQGDVAQDTAAVSAQKDSGFRAKRFRSRSDVSAAAAPAPASEPSVVIANAPSNDAVAQNGQDDAQKKKGWWNRLIEK